jgi:hypothetical protein
MRSSLAVLAFTLILSSQADPAVSSVPVVDRTFIFENPTLDLLAVTALAKKKSPTPAPAPASNILPLLVLSGALNNRGGTYFGNSYDQFGNPQDPVKKALLLSGIASGSVSPLTAVAMDRNPGMTTADTLVASALGNNPLTSLLILNQPPGQGLLNGGGIFGQQGYYGGSYNGFYNQGGLGGQGYYQGGLGGQGYYNQGGLGNQGILPALVVAGAVGGSTSGLGTLLALGALGGGFGNNRGYTNGYFNGGYQNGAYYNGGYTGGFYNQGSFGNVGNNLHNLFG